MGSQSTRLPTTSPRTGSSLRLQLMSRQLLRRETTSPPPLLFEVATSSSTTISLLGLRETHKHYLMKYNRDLKQKMILHHSKDDGAVKVMLNLPFQYCCQCIR